MAGMGAAGRTVVAALACALPLLVAGCDASRVGGESGPHLGGRLPARLPQSSGTGGRFWVDGAGGDDAADGSHAHPWRTINHALATVPLRGSIVTVADGTYTSSGTDYAITFNRTASTRDPVTLRAEHRGKALVRGAAGQGGEGTLGAWIVHARGLRVDGFDFLLDAAGANSVLVEQSDRIEFTRNAFHQSGCFQVRGGKSDGTPSRDVWLYANVFRPTGDSVYAQATGNPYPTTAYSGSRGSHYVYAGQVGDVGEGFRYRSGSERFVVANNVFSGTTAGRHVELGPQARHSFVVNNTFFGNHAGSLIGWDTEARYAGQGVEFFADTSSKVPAATRDNVVANNIFMDLDGHAVFGSGPSEAGNLVTHNLAYLVRNQRGNDGDPHDAFAERYGDSVLFTDRANAQGLDPAFADVLGLDFHLLGRSPAIGAADPALTPPLDADGSRRHRHPDLGAFEHASR